MADAKTKEDDTAKVRAKARQVITKLVDNAELGEQIEKGLFSQYNTPNTHYKLHYKALTKLLQDKPVAAETVNQLKSGALTVKLLLRKAQELQKEAPADVASSSSDLKWNEAAQSPATPKSPAKNKAGVKITTEEDVIRLLHDAVQAKKEVTKTPGDGILWLKLADAYCDQFYASSFMNYHQLALKAYQQAAVSKQHPQAHNSHLLIRRANLFRIQEDYASALADLKQARELDPSKADVATQEINSILHFLRSMQRLVATKANLKGKQLEKATKVLTIPEQKITDRVVVNIPELAEGKNDGKAIQASILVGVHRLSENPSERPDIPLSFVITAKDGATVGLSIYNIVGNVNDEVREKSLVYIADPILTTTTVEYEGETISFKSIAVRNPNTLFVDLHPWNPKRIAFDIGTA